MYVCRYILYLTIIPFPLVVYELPDILISLISCSFSLAKRSTMSVFFFQQLLIGYEVIVLPVEEPIKLHNSSYIYTVFVYIYTNNKNRVLNTEWHRAW